MSMSDEAMMKLCEAMRIQYGAGAEFELALGDLVGRYRHAHEMHMREKQAADLLALGPDTAAERQGCHRSTVYRRASRFYKVARLLLDATESA